MRAEQTIPLCVIAGDTQQFLGFAVVGFQFVIRQWPVLPDAVHGLDAKVVGQESRYVSEEMPRGTSHSAKVCAGVFRFGSELVVALAGFRIRSEPVASPAFVRCAGAALQCSSVGADKLDPLWSSLAGVQHQHIVPILGEFPR